MTILWISWGNDKQQMTFASDCVMLSTLASMTDGKNMLYYLSSL